MIESIREFDVELFLAIHSGLSNSFFDWLLPLMRNKYFWAPLYLFIIVFSFIEYKKKGWYIVGMLLFTFGMGDMLASRIIKPMVARIRPCNDFILTDEIIRRVPCGSGLSFPSAHATNHFAIAVFLIFVFYDKWKPVLPIGIAWAFIISFSQIYVGVHYPIDTLAGAILGSCIGLVSAKLYRTLQPAL